MEEAEIPPPPPPASTYLRRRNSIATTSVTIPTKLSLPKHLHTSSSLPLNGTISSPTIDLDLISSLSYTSLKDILPPSAVNSPTAATNSGYEISIRNRLVKQAAWAYLQPMASSPDSSGPHFLRRLCLRFSDCFRPIIPAITRLFGRILRIIRVQVSR